MGKMFFAVPIPYHVKVSVFNRVIAKCMDFVIVVALATLLPYPLGSCLGFIYSLLADGLNFGPFKGQSIGKWLMGLQVIHLIRQKPAELKDSALRNAPVGVATFFSFIPVWGWLILALIGLPMMVMEIYLMLSVKDGHRLGDVMGDTEVIEVEEKE